MGKLLKWILKLLAYLLLLSLLLVLAVAWLFDPNDYKHHVSDYVQQETGHQLDISGPVTIQWFPSLDLQLSQVSLVGGETASQPALFSAAGLQLALDWQAMLERKVTVDSLLLMQPVLQLSRDQQGQGNWESLLRELSTPAPRVTKETDADFALRIRRLQLEDANIHWLDHTKNKVFELKHLNLSTGVLQPGKPALIRVQLNLSVVQPQLELDLSASGELDADERFEKLDIYGMALEIKASGGAVSQQGLQLEMAADLSLDLPTELFQLNDLSLAGPDTHITGQLHGHGFAGLPELDGRLVMQQTNLKSLLGLVGVELATPDPQALTRVSMDVGLQQQGELLLIRPIEVQMDDSLIRGEAALRAADNSHLKMMLELDQLDLDRYLSADEQADSGPGFQLSEEIAGLRKLQLDAELTVTELKRQDLLFRDASLKVYSREGALQLQH